jgi:DNA-binding response OmpR family regulator
MRAVLAREVIHLVLLDLMMPGEDGLSLARYIRQHSEIPIIMLTGKGDLIDRVVGLETGADDYIPKPFELREVLARIRTVMRRAGPRAVPAAPVPAGNTSEVLVFEGWRLDVLRRELRRQAGDLVPLTAGEFELLCAFARHPNRVLNRDQLIDLFRGREWACAGRESCDYCSLIHAGTELERPPPGGLFSVHVTRQQETFRPSERRGAHHPWLGHPM